MNATSAVLCIAAALAAAGCRSHPNLIITEVGEREVEIFLQEPATRTLNLDGVTLHYASSNGDTARIPLFGALNGGEYLIVWEAAGSGYQGAPADQTYTNWAGTNIRGIVVADGTFGTPGPGDAFAYRLEGVRQGFQVFIPSEEVIEDKVLFGAHAPSAAPPVLRPDLGGPTYTEDFSTAGDVRVQRVGRIKAKTIQRKWTMTYEDNSSEQDLGLHNENFGTHP